MTQVQKSRRPSRRLVLRLALVFLAALLVGPPLLSLVLRHERIHRALLSRIEASFGRPVEASSFSVSLLGGLRVEANYVTVAEDPRFGHEFFLRADQITASLRWAALLRGRVEFGNLALLRPSLNLVRNAEGRWNLLAWLPPAGAAQVPGPEQTAPPRLYRIEVDTGRVNFKEGPDKHPFALVDVNGNFALSSAGNWQVDFVAQAFRAGTMTQEPGELRVRGAIGGPQSRILPANMTLTWDDASVADVMRLLRGRDFGFRGQLGAELNVTATPVTSPAEATWSFSGSARISGLHGRDLPPRASDPAVNFRVEADWYPAQWRVQVRNALLETANSSVRAAGEIDWQRDAAKPSALRVASGGVDFADVFAFYQAFRESVATGVRVEGSAALEAEFGGWPPRLQSLLMSSPGARLHVPGSAAPLVASRAAIRYDARRELIEFAPISITVAEDAAATVPRGAASSLVLRFDGRLRRGKPWQWPAEWNLSGTASSAQTLQQAGVALGLYSMRVWQAAGWAVDGAAELKLRWATSLFPFTTQAGGSIELRRATLTAPLLAAPMASTRLQFEFGGPLRVLVSEAESFGARWSGSLTAAGTRAWEVALNAPRMDSAAFDRSLAASGDNPHGLVEALRPASAVAGPVRARGLVRLNPQLPSPFLRPLRAVDLSLDVSLELPARRRFRLSGTLAAPEIQRPAAPQR